MKGDPRSCESPDVEEHLRLSLEGFQERSFGQTGEGHRREESLYTSRGLPNTRAAPHQQEVSLEMQTGQNCKGLVCTQVG